jgi:hypothetical protein
MVLSCLIHSVISGTERKYALSNFTTAHLRFRCTDPWKNYKLRLERERGEWFGRAESS